MDEALDAQGEAALERLLSDKELQALMERDPQAALAQAGFPDLDQEPIDVTPEMVAELEQLAQARPLMMAGQTPDVRVEELGKGGIDIIFSKDGTEKLRDVLSFGEQASGIIGGAIAGLSLATAGVAGVAAGVIILVLRAKSLQVKWADKGKGIHVPLPKWKLGALLVAAPSPGAFATSAALINPRSN